MDDHGNILTYNRQVSEPFQNLSGIEGKEEDIALNRGAKKTEETEEKKAQIEEKEETLACGSCPALPSVETIDPATLQKRVDEEECNMNLFKTINNVNQAGITVDQGKKTPEDPTFDFEKELQNWYCLCDKDQKAPEENLDEILKELENYVIRGA